MMTSQGSEGCITHFIIMWAINHRWLSRSIRWLIHTTNQKTWQRRFENSIQCAGRSVRAHVLLVTIKTIGVASNDALTHVRLKKFSNPTCDSQFIPSQFYVIVAKKVLWRSMIAKKIKIYLVRHGQKFLATPMKTAKSPHLNFHNKPLLCQPTNILESRNGRRLFKHCKRLF